MRSNDHFQLYSRGRKFSSRTSHALNPYYTYISTGFSNWKDSSVRLSAHETKTAVLKTVTLPATTRDVGELLSAAHAQDRLDRRQCFLKLLSNVRFLARQALPLRGDGDESDSNYIQLFKLRGDDARVFDWLRKKTDKHTSADMPNEMMARQVVRKVTASLHTTPFYTIMADETTDNRTVNKLSSVFDG